MEKNENTPVSIQSLTEKHSVGRENQIKAIFANLFIVQNRLQTIFDRDDSEITIKQFLLLIMLKQSGEQLTFTQLGSLLGCSRQNIKKLALSLEQKGFVSIGVNTADARACTVQPELRLEAYFNKVNKKQSKMLKILFSSYTDSEVTDFFTALAKMHGTLEKLEQSITKGAPDE